MMGKACKPPAQTHKRRYWITDHAIEQLRERFKRDGTRHRGQQDLGNLIDYSVRCSVREGRSEEIIDGGIDAVLVDLRETLHDDLWAILKPNTCRRQDEFPQAVVTLLEHWQVARSKRSDKWKFKYEQKSNSVGGLPEKAKLALQQMKERLP
jgi:hypothetical protein